MKALESFENKSFNVNPVIPKSKEKLDNAIIKTYDFKITSGFSPEFKIGYVIAIDGQSYDVMYNSKIEDLLK